MEAIELGEECACPPQDWRSSRPQDFEALQQSPLFCTLTAQCLHNVTAEAVMLRPARGDMVFHQGETPRALHVLIEGQVGLLGGVSDGEETVVEILRPGECFIEAAVMMARPYLMGAVALQNSRILALPADRFRRDLTTNPDLSTAMLSSLSKHYRALVREVKDLKLKSAAQRLAIYLLALSSRREGKVIVRLPHSKGVIAARIGVRAETLSRAFAALKTEGVAVSSSLITIADVNKLSAFCNEGEELI